MKRNFAEWLLTFTDSIANYKYYIDFETIYKNALKLNILIHKVLDFKEINHEEIACFVACRHSCAGAGAG